MQGRDMDARTQARVEQGPFDPPDLSHAGQEHQEAAFIHCQ
jgi:hypothetical protein